MTEEAVRLHSAALTFGADHALRVPAIEAARQLPRDLAERMRAIGLFRMFVPKTHGGDEVPLPDSLPPIEALSNADGVFGWLAMIGSHLPLVASALSRHGFDALYTDDPNLIGGGSVTPGGRAELEAGGYRVSGRWPFASGCQHADYLFAFCVEVENGVPLPGPAPGVPMIRVVFAPASAFQIEDTWHASGLKGTGSHHIRLEDCLVPAHMSYRLFDATPCVRGPLYFAGPFAVLVFHIGAVALGVAEGALRDLVASADRRQFAATQTMRDSEVFQHEIGLADADIAAARALLYRTAETAWSEMSAGRDEPARSVQSAQAMTWVVHTCARAVDRCYTLGGGSAVYEASPLQRRLRDAHAITQHVIAHYKSYGMAGRLRLGFPPVSAMTGLPISHARTTSTRT